MRISRPLAAVAALCLVFVPQAALAAEGLDGASFGFIWALPFTGILLSIALGPLAFHRLWEHHYGKAALAWALLTALPLALARGAGTAVEALLHTMLLEYLPFIILLFALFTCAGGILVKGNLHGSPAVNTLLLALGTGLASLIGTTGASMVLIRPLLRANDNRRHNVHTVVFFIFLVSNIGGSLTPLGDPPLFLGFLKGVDFFWTTKHLLPQTTFMVVALLAVFFLLDTALYRREEGMPPLRDPTPDSRLGLEGLVNLPLIGIIIAAILMSANWKPGVVLRLPGAEIELQNLLRDAIILGVAFASLALTDRSIRHRNGFTWGPIVEVAKLFAGIFTCMIPVLAMLKAGPDGAFAPLVALVTDPTGAPVNAAYFWLVGGLSSFLDNAPTYLVFFQLAGGEAQTLMGPMALTLAAISAGAVFMGANSYIGNAPNFMVYAIARHRGVKMPSFFGYMLWSGGILVPLFVVATFIFFR
ncbi:sodium:proton antiporter [Chelatococcus sp. SYSU_G07232]|uniref:Sodium:proton antiporter n=1 Tax=Chelatococcus albus TaxID=3047466 RepID=A0ABT7AL91_9HYPH|nr:sodium:proton antiporter [Chelatococcus sp. SYSU_G07232]MDJ1160152.1 sodium:proton antiporter [Chelatococcus sp. SYSU_G07232]